MATRKKKRSGLPVGVRRHGNGFRAVVTAGGVRQRSKTLPSADDAAEWRAQFLAVRATPGNQPLDLALTGALQLILEDLQATGAKDGTRQFYTAHAATLITHFGALTKLHNIDAAMIREFILARREAGIEPSTIVKRELQTLKRMRKLASAAGYALPIDPFDGLRLPKVRVGRFEFLTQHRVGELVAAMRRHTAPLAKWHADIVELLFSTGLRRAELCRLRVQDIDFAAGRIYVDGKTGHRYQSFGRALVPLLERLVAAAKGGKVTGTVDTIEKAFESWQRRLKEPRLTPHVLRHSYGTAMAQHVTPFDLMGLMGHASLNQTSRYFHARGDAVRTALDALRLDPPTPPPSAPSPAPGPSEPPSEPPERP